MPEFPKLDYIFQTPDQNPSWSLMDGMEKGVKPFFQACLQGSGAMPEVALSIMDGSIAPSVSYNAVDTEGQSAIDELEMIETAQSNDGMELYLKAACKDRQVLVKHSHVLNGISLAEGKDVYLTPDAYLKLKRNGSKWVEVRSSARVRSYELCEFYYFRHPVLKPGFQPAHGGILANAATLCPEAWDYLQTAEGQLLCKTEAEWQAMTRAVWHTNANGTKIGWNGIGGAPFYVVDTQAGTLRLPDLRGMYAEASGFDGLGVGSVHGDAIREIAGAIDLMHTDSGDVNGYGAMYGVLDITYKSGAAPSQTNTALDAIWFNASRVVPTAAKNQPRAWGALACVYLGALN